MSQEKELEPVLFAFRRNCQETISRLCELLADGYTPKGSVAGVRCTYFLMQPPGKDRVIEVR